MNTKRAVLIAVLAVVIAALAVPLVGLRAAASGTTGKSIASPKPAAASASTATEAVQQNQTVEDAQATGDNSQMGKISPEVLKALGLTKAKDPKAVSARIRNLLQSKKAGGSTGDFSTQSGQPTVLNARSALSAALITTIGGRDNQFSEV